MRDVSLVQKDGAPTVVVKYSGDIEIKTENHDHKMVLFLIDCASPSGSHVKPGDGAVIQRVRWNYKDDQNATWIVIELNSKAEGRLVRNDREIHVRFKPAETTADPKRADHPFQGRKSAIPADVEELMMKSTWREGCPLRISELVLVEVSYWGFDDAPHTGRLIVHKNLGDDVIAVFKELYEQSFPIEKIRLIEHYQGDDGASMADNNTSAFNCRYVSGTQKYSLHSYGKAIDVNPLINPFVQNGRVSPAEGKKYIDRSKPVPGMIVQGGPCLEAFKKRGWSWGGDWKSMKDYQHFEKK